MGVAMAEICTEARTYADSCEACGQFTTAEKLRALCDWIDIQQDTINAQKHHIRELEKFAPKNVFLKPNIGRKANVD